MSGGSAAAPIALTCGDPAGIGPDITIASWLGRNEHKLPAFAVLADADHLEARAAQLGVSLPLERIDDIAEAGDVFASALPVLSLPLPHPVTAGKPDGAAAAAVRDSIERAVDLALSGAASAVVTNPIAKHVLADAGFDHPGHTEFLGAVAIERGHAASPVMMLTGGGLRVVPVTIHIALVDVPRALTTEKIIETVRVTAAGLKRWFGIAEPRLALSGLNPHAGENGLMGHEDDRVIRPAIAALRDLGYQVSGPHPADTMFHERARRGYDVAIAMYHDQALIPIKTLAFDEGVNVTLGLPFIRTSPDHGTAFDIAGSGKARPNSLIAALRLAAQMAETGGHAAPDDR